MIYGSFNIIILLGMSCRLCIFEYMISCNTARTAEMFFLWFRGRGIINLQLNKLNHKIFYDIKYQALCFLLKETLCKTDFCLLIILGE